MGERQSANQTGANWAELIFAVTDNSDISAERERVMGHIARTWLDWPA